MTTQRQPAQLSEYWVGIHQSINARLVALKSYLKHPASGGPIEGYFRDLLREYLPRRYVVEPGFVVNADGDRSDELDVIIADLQDIPPLCSEPLLKVYPAEAVVAAIEITSAPKATVHRVGIGRIPKLQDDILKLARLRRLGRRREYVDSSPLVLMIRNRLHMLMGTRSISFDHAPRTFLITCGDEWRKAKTFQTHLDTALTSAAQRVDNVWINSVFSVEHGMIYFKPYTSNFESERKAKYGLLEFILFLNKAISDYQTFRINVTRYRPTLPEQQEETATTEGVRETNGAHATHAVE